jgi:hypothetical protein
MLSAVLRPSRGRDLDGTSQQTPFTQTLQEKPMKKTDLDRNEGLKITGQMKQAGTPDRFGSAAGALVSRRDQRKLDQAQGLVAFAVKLDGELVRQIHALAQARQMGINETVAALLTKGLAD